MRVTFKCTNGECIVTINGQRFLFDTVREALTFIFDIRKECTL